jgi:hypothetical protein
MAKFEMTSYSGAGRSSIAAAGLMAVVLAACQTAPPSPWTGPTRIATVVTVPPLRGGTSAATVLAPSLPAPSTPTQSPEPPVAVDLPPALSSLQVVCIEARVVRILQNGFV